MGLIWAAFELIEMKKPHCILCVGAFVCIVCGYIYATGVSNTNAINLYQLMLQSVVKLVIIIVLSLSARGRNKNDVIRL